MMGSHTLYDSFAYGFSSLTGIRSGLLQWMYCEAEEDC